MSLFFFIRQNFLTLQPDVASWFPEVSGPAGSDPNGGHRGGLVDPQLPFMSLPAGTPWKSPLTEQFL